jgi:hypothetical protein
MAENHLEPAKTVISKIGGVEAAASITGKHVSRVYRWMYPRDKGGTGGAVPHEDATKLLEHAKANGLPLAAADFFAGGQELVA